MTVRWPLKPVIIILHVQYQLEWTASASVRPPHQSVMTSNHLLADLPRDRSPSAIPSIIVFTIIDQTSSVQLFKSIRTPRPRSSISFVLNKLGHVGQYFYFALFQWRRTNLKFGMAAPYQSYDIWAVDSRENQ